MKVHLALIDVVSVKKKKKASVLRKPVFIVIIVLCICGN